MSNVKENAVEQLVAQAESILQKQPFDSGHDLEHHTTVLALALDIASHIDQPVDTDAVRIASMWHDVVTQNVADKDVANRSHIKEDTCDYLGRQMTSLGFRNDLIMKTVTAVRYHSFGDQPQNIEGEVLFDADKLAALDIPRWQKIVQSYKLGLIDQKHYDGYISAGKVWIAEMHSKLHFEYSRQLFKARIKALLEDEWSRSLAEQLGVHLENYL